MTPTLSEIGGHQVVQELVRFLELLPLLLFARALLHLESLLLPQLRP